MQQFFSLLSWRLFTERTLHGYHHYTKVKPEAAAAVVELLMMGGRTPETCWAVNKRQDNKLKNCCIWLEIYLNCTMMHGLTNLKFISNVLLRRVSTLKGSSSASTTGRFSQRLSSYNKPTRCTNFSNLFWKETLQVSDRGAVRNM
jgi:hypothetical protein